MSVVPRSRLTSSKFRRAFSLSFAQYDNCNSNGSKPEVRYPIMRDGKTFFFSRRNLQEQWNTILINIEWSTVWRLKKNQDQFFSGKIEKLEQ